MFSHVTIGSNDPDQAAAFYDAVLGALQIPQLFKFDGLVAYGELSGPKTFILRPFDGDAAAAGNGNHVAFLASSRSQVDAFHAKALEMGGSNEGAPGLRTHDHPHYYGAYIRDPEGNKLQAVCHSKKG